MATPDPAQLCVAPRASFLISTYNRRDVLLHTIEQVFQCGLSSSDFEVIVVDNASADGTADAVERRFPTVKLLRQKSNRGPCAKNAGLHVARGQYIVFLDDDSYPEPGSVDGMVRKFRADPLLGAAVFSITLPDGSQECSAYPDVCIGCGTGFRASALSQVGGLPDDFFMAAEEYDLSLRLLDAGWRVRRFEDLHVTHLKSAASRFPARIARLDARNNMLLAFRYFPDPWRTRYASEWLARYRLMANADGHRAPFWRGAIAGMALGLGGKRRPMGAAAFEQFSRLEETLAGMKEAARQLGLRRVMFADLGKNILAYRRAARECGLEVVGIADARLGGRGMRFRGLPLFSDAHAARVRFDAVIISNLSPVHARLRAQRWRALDSRPVLDLFACIPQGSNG